MVIYKFYFTSDDFLAGRICKNNPEHSNDSNIHAMIFIKSKLDP